MKKIFLSVIVFIQLQSFSQGNVGIGTNTPNSSAILDLTSSNKGLLIPRVTLQTVVDANTIASPATGLLVYNTNLFMTGGAGFFYNSGTPASPVWTKVGDMPYPYFKSFSTNGTAFHIENLNAANTSVAIKASTLAGTALYATGGSGYALQAYGKIKIAGTGQSPYYGKVLTTDGEGNATWEGAIGFATYGVAEGNDDLPYGVNKKVDFKIEQYDSQNNLSNSIFTAPVAGIYHFDATITFDAAHNITPQSPVTHHLFLMSKKSGVTSIILETENDAATTDALSISLSTDVRLITGEQVWIEVWQNHPTQGSLWTENSKQRFSGHLLYKVVQGLFE